MSCSRTLNVYGSKYSFIICCINQTDVHRNQPACEHAKQPFSCCFKMSPAVIFYSIYTYVQSEKSCQQERKYFGTRFYSALTCNLETSSWGYKLCSCSTQPSMKLVLLINIELLKIANSFLLNIAEHENFSANKCENTNFCWHFHIY